MIRRIDIPEPPQSNDEPAAAAPDRKQRTTAQRETSRRNGTRSRGPTTTKGKQRSRANAVKHGLFCNVVAPAWETSPDVRAATELLPGLLEEYQPRTQMERLLVELLADDFACLRRAKEIHRLALEPEQMKRYSRIGGVWLPREDPHHWAELHDSVLKAEARCTKGQPCAMGREDAVEIAALIWQEVAEWRKVIAEHEGDDTAGGQPEPPDEDVEDCRQALAEADLQTLGIHSEADLIRLLTATTLPGVAPDLLRRSLPGLLRIVIGHAFVVSRNHDEATRAQWALRLQQLERLPSVQTLQAYEDHFYRRAMKTMRKLEELRGKREGN